MIESLGIVGVYTETKLCNLGSLIVNLLPTLGQGFQRLCTHFQIAHGHYPEITLGPIISTVTVVLEAVGRLELVGGLVEFVLLALILLMKIVMLRH
jgi:hypothetical protein